jgi:hypothetical protein
MDRGGLTAFKRDPSPEATLGGAGDTLDELGVRARQHATPGPVTGIPVTVFFSFIITGTLASTVATETGTDGGPGGTWICTRGSLAAKPRPVAPKPRFFAPVRGVVTALSTFNIPAQKTGQSKLF